MRLSRVALVGLVILNLTVGAASAAEAQTNTESPKVSALARAKQRSALVVFNALNSGSSTATLAARSAAAPGSAAFNYLATQAEDTDASNWNDYTSKGLALPTPTVGTVKLSGPKANPGSAVTWTPANSGSLVHRLSFDSTGKVTSWVMNGGVPLASRIWAVTGSGSGSGAQVTAKHVYVTNAGTPMVTAAISNQSGGPIIVASPATYVGLDGVGHNMTFSMFCVQAGQIAPFSAYSDSIGNGGVPSKLTISVIPDPDGSCSWWRTNDEVRIDVPLN